MNNQSLVMILIKTVLIFVTLMFGGLDIALLTTLIFIMQSLTRIEYKEK